MPTTAQAIKPKKRQAGGVVSSTMTNDGSVPIPKVEDYSNVKPAESVIDPATETVEGRIGALTSGDSRYVNLARSGAQRSAAKRGMINTAMAAGLGEEAAIKQALPIAQQDARTYADRAVLTQTEANKFGLAEQASGLSMREKLYGSGLSKDEAAYGSELAKSEAAYGSELAKGEAAYGSELTKTEATHGSGLAKDEAAYGSELTKGEATHGSELAKDEAAYGSELAKGEVTHKTDVTTAAQKELNVQNATLNMEIDAFKSALSMNEESWSKELQTSMELTLANEKLSNDMKIQYVQAINGIMADTQQQISDIGLSDRTPAAQAAAIFRLEQNRDASIKVYEDMIASSDTWEWSTDFTPASVTTLAEQSNYWNAPGGAKPINEPKVGENVGGKVYAGNGVWNDPLSFDND